MIRSPLCKLLPTNKRLKQIIKEHGEVWSVMTAEKSVQCFNDSKTGVFIESKSKLHSRWVRPTDIIYLKDEGEDQ